MMRKYMPIVALLMLTSCNVDLDALTSPPAGRSQLPARLDALCSPVFRDADIAAIIISMNTELDAGISKSAAIEAAIQSCEDNAAQLAAAGVVEDNGFDFDELDAVDYRADCTNCLIALIDALYD